MVSEVTAFETKMERQHNQQMLYLLLEEQRREAARVRILAREKDSKVRARLERNFRLARALARRKIVAVQSDNHEAMVRKKAERHFRAQQRARAYLTGVAKTYFVARKLAFHRIAAQQAARRIGRRVRAWRYRMRRRRDAEAFLRRIARHARRQGAARAQLRFLVEAGRAAQQAEEARAGDRPHGAPHAPRA